MEHNDGSIPTVKAASRDYAAAIAVESAWKGHSSDLPPPVVDADRPSWIEHFPIIVHSHLRWDFVWQRPQQILSRLADMHPIAFVEDPVVVDVPDAAPRLDISEPQFNLVRIVPVLPREISGVDDQCEAVLALMRVAFDAHPLLRYRFERPVQWFYSPMTAPGLLGKFGRYGVVYDCMDELANFRFAPEDIGEREAYLLDNAQIVFTGGRQLFEAKSLRHGNVHFHGCGVDVDHFGRARLAATEIPETLSGLPRPIFGYFGVIDERLDYPLIAALARRFPEASIVMAGPLAKVDADQLPEMANIHWLGQQSYDALPAIVKAFDVCLMPFALNEATRYINPTKTLEYMAACKPVVSTAVADVVRNFTPIVDVARTGEEFLTAVERAWLRPDNIILEAGVARAQNSTWTSTVTTMRSELQAALEPHLPASSVREACEVAA